MAGEQGFLYERKINKILKDAGLEKQSFMPAGSDSNAPDAMLLYKGKEYKLEIKLDIKADFGQGSLAYDEKKKKWVIAGSKTPSGQAMREFLESIGAEKIVNRAWTKAPRKGTVPDERITPKDVKYDYENFKDQKVRVDPRAIADYYNTKKTYYIQIGDDHGLYYMGKDIADVGCPEFKPDVQLRIRLKRGGSNPIYNYRFATALQVKKLEKSNMDIENKLDVQAMSARSKSK
jgi:hypothetical protein